MKNYLIVGASSGIGKKLAETLVEQGNHVIGTFNTTPIDDADYQQYDVLHGEMDTNEFPEHIDGLVYCPGSINLLPFSRLKPEQFVDDFELQVVGAIKVIQSALPFLKKAEQASVVLYSTVAVQTGFNFHSQVSTSKGAIEGLMRALAAEFAPKIRFNAIAPSLTQTPLASQLLSNEAKVDANAERHPLKRVGQASDIAEASAFLLSDKSSWITGQVIPVDGGMSSLKI